MEIIGQWTFPVPSICINKGVSLIFKEGNIELLFDYYDEETDNIFNSGIAFEVVVAHRHSSEKFTRFINESYDELIEIKDSEWVKELSTISPEWAKFWEIRHFGIYLDSYGFYEFIAKDYKIKDIKEGALKEGH